jgi:hypothetical protein
MHAPFPILIFWSIPASGGIPNAILVAKELEQRFTGLQAFGSIAAIWHSEPQSQADV